MGANDDIPRFTFKQVGAMRVLHKHGMPLTEIGAVFGVSQSTIQNWIHKQKSDYINKRKKALIIEMMLDGHSDEYISDVLWVKPCEVRKFLDSKQNSQKKTPKLKKKPVSFAGVPCKIFTCPEFKWCNFKDEPQECQVWQLYGSGEKEYLVTGCKALAKKPLEKQARRAQAFKAQR